ncbi:MAG: exosome complex protein Rrp42 [Candidatus Caldarchaeales archaeon]|jgi:exosome complex component RRP42|nr:exosome complex protein Rrp42 [Candidatus Caldarchaeales archaeon]
MYRVGAKPYPTKIMQDKLYELISRGERLDGRKPHEHRPLDIKTSVIEKAEGSALVTLGGTKIIAGVKTSLGAPYPDTPNQANIVVNAELLPLASSYFEPGPPDEKAIELARVVDRCIRESKMLDLEKLVYIPGKSVLVIYVDVYVLDYDGNYFDPSVLASVAALATAKVPAFHVRDGEVVLDPESRVGLPIKKLPVSVTVGFLRDKIIVDPTALEESAIDTSLVLGWSDENEVAAIQKSLPGLMRESLLDELITVTREKSIELRAKLMSAVGRIGLP